jgi:hypothetical protein
MIRVERLLSGAIDRANQTFGGAASCRDGTLYNPQNAIAA